MEYGQAARIRSSGLSNLISNKLIGGASVTGSIRGALSDKMKARATGMKEKFDILNIARVVTGGSRLGPAVVGRLLGRSRSDIKYFADKSKSLSRKTGSLEKVSSGYGNVDSEKLADRLNSMYNMLRSSRERDLRLRELEQGTLEEKRNEDERRHQEFLEVLHEFVGKKPTATAVAGEVKDEGGGIFNSIMKMINDLQEKIAKFWDELKDLKNLIKLGSGAKTLGSTLANAAKVAGGALASGAEAAAGALARVPGGPALLFLTPYALAAHEKEKIRQNPNAPEYKNNPYAMVLRGEAKTEEEAANKNRMKALKGDIRRMEIEQAVNSDLDDRTLMEEYGATREELKKWLSDKNNKLFKGASIKTTPGTLHRLGVESSTAGAGRGTASLTDYMARQLEAETGGRAAFGVRAHGIAPATPRVAELSEELQDLSMGYDAMGNVTGMPMIINQQTSTNTKDKPVPTTPKVRDDTQILQRTFRNSTVRAN